MIQLLCYEGGKIHTWKFNGLDINQDGQLVNVRSCLRCTQEQEKPYGAGGKKPWKSRKLKV